MKRYCIIAAALTILSSLALAAASDQDKGTTKSFSVSKNGLLEVAISGGDIKISGWDKDEVLVRAIGIEVDDLDQLDMHQTGKTVSVRFHSSWGPSSDFRLDISVPSQFDLELENSGGDIKIDGPLAGTLRGSTSAGNIKLGDLGGTIRMETSGGDIQTGNIRGDLNISTSGGDIRLGTISGEAEISTSGGEIIMENVGKQLRAQTSGGNIQIGDVGSRADVTTAGGNIDIGKVSGSATLSTAGGNIHLLGASGVVTAKTSGGDLEMRNVTGSIDGKTAGGDINVGLHPGPNSVTRLSTAAGDISLYIPEDAKATIDARIRIDNRWHDMSREFGITSDFPMEKYEKDKETHRILGTIRINGGGETITLETTAGNIHVYKGEPQK
jgi:DUF4097 and DUF4098 domain-containing protein YvlB